MTVTHPELLDADSEVRLAELIEAGAAADRCLSSGAPCSDHDRRALEAQARRGREARDRFVAANLRLVISIARHYEGRGVDLSDLVQEGSIGLVRAVDRFDHHRGFRFSTFATYCIRQSILTALDDSGSFVRVPRNRRADGRTAARVRSELEMVLGRTPTTDEVAEAAGMTSKRVRAAVGYASPMISLSASAGDDDDAELGAFVADPSAISPESEVTDELMGETVRALVATLPPRAAAALRLRFGLDGDEPVTLDEAARRMGISRERVRQLEQQALNQLRRQVRTKDVGAIAAA